MASVSARPTTASGAIPTMHLGSFSRMEIADFDSRGRYPTTPSPNELRTPGMTDSVWLQQQQQEQWKQYYNSEQISADRQGPSTSPELVPNASVNGTPATQPYDPPMQDSLIQDTPAQELGQDSSNRPPMITSRNSSSTIGTLQRTSNSKPPVFNPANIPQPLASPGAASYSAFATLYTPAPVLPVQNVRPAQLPPPAEEVCIECMMRDRDMADVDVTGPGIWDRESDIFIHDLIERENEEERQWREQNAAELAIPGNKLRPPRRQSKGNRLTEQNLKIWLTLNPKESQARLMTIDAYIKQQTKLLVVEAEARAKAQQEAQRLDARMKDTYSQLRASAYDIGTTGLAIDDFSNGVRIQPPRASGIWESSPGSHKEDQKHRRDMTLLDNGMIMERINPKKEEKERKREEKKMRKASVTTDVSMSSPYYPPGTPGLTPMDLGSESHQHLATPNSQSRPMSAPMGAPLSRIVNPSHTSIDGRSSRFLGSKHWLGAWGSGASVAASGSMQDMHAALYQEQHKDVYRDNDSAHHAFSSVSLPASPRKSNVRPSTASGAFGATESRSPSPQKKKEKGLGRLWKKVTRKEDGKDRPYTAGAGDDMGLPPPPPMSYLVNNNRVPPSPHLRQVSTPGLPNGRPSSHGHHPRTISQPGFTAASPTTAPSSSIPSPTSNRFQYRESVNEDIRRSLAGRDPAIEAESPQAPDQGSASPYSEGMGPKHAGALSTSSSEYGRNLQIPNGIAQPRSPAPSTVMSSSMHNGRPLSTVHKTLPPIPFVDPSGNTPRPVSAVPASMSLPNSYQHSRPNTMLFPEGVFVPPTPFRSDGFDARRGSVSSLSAMRADNLPQGAGWVQTLQPKRSTPAMPTYTDSPVMYQEFGLPNQYQNDPSQKDTTKANKRRSRFTLSTYFGKKDKEKDKNQSPFPFYSVPTPNGRPMTAGSASNYAQQFYAPPSSPPPPRPPFGHVQKSRSSASLLDPELMNGNSGLYSQQPTHPQFGFSTEGRPISVMSTGARSNMSTGARSNKAALIDEVVTKDRDFLAYRYPSTEQTIDISRR